MVDAANAPFEAPALSSCGLKRGDIVREELHPAVDGELFEDRAHPLLSRHDAPDAVEDRQRCALFEDDAGDAEVQRLEPAHLIVTGHVPWSLKERRSGASVRMDAY